MKAKFRWSLAVLAIFSWAVLILFRQSISQHYQFAGSQRYQKPQRTLRLNGTTSQCPFNDSFWMLHLPSMEFPKLAYGDAHAYTAHYDSRKNAVMVILDVGAAAYHGDSALTGLRCLLEYASYDALLEVSAQEEYRFYSTPGKSSVNVLYACRLPADAPAGAQPSSVGLWESAAPPCTASLVLPVLRSGSLEEPQQGALMALDVKVNFAVCTSPFSRNFNSAVALAEFVEVNSLFGAERFVFYNYSAGGPELWRLLDSYVKDGVAAVVPWPLYDGNEERIPYFAQMAAFQDCLYRNLWTAKYVAVMDLDEFIVPRVARADGTTWSWDDIATRSRCGLDHRPSALGSWLFRNTFFKLEWPDGKLYGGSAADGGAGGGGTAKRYGMQTLLKTWREKLIWRPTERSKYFVRADRADHLLVHTPELLEGFVDCHVPIGEALLQHYRDWGDPYVEQDMLLKGVEDRFLAERHGAEIERRIGERLLAAGVVGT